MILRFLRRRLPEITKMVVVMKAALRGGNSPPPILVFTNRRILLNAHFKDTDFV